MRSHVNILKVSNLISVCSNVNWFIHTYWVVIAIAASRLSKVGFSSSRLYSLRIISIHSTHRSILNHVIIQETWAIKCSANVSLRLINISDIPWKAILLHSVLILFKLSLVYTRFFHHIFRASCFRFFFKELLIFRDTRNHWVLLIVIVLPSC